MVNNEKVLHFSEELLLIGDPHLRLFVQKMLESTGDWFFIDPASTSGKHHPQYALGKGGLVRHTKAVVKWAVELERTKMFDIDPVTFDFLIAAAIMHDIRKHTADGKYVENHAEAGAQAVMDLNKECNGLIGDWEATQIANAIKRHMGIWGKDTPKTPLDKLLHLADYCASRKELEFDTKEL